MACSVNVSNKKNQYSDQRIDKMCIKTCENQIICFPSTKKNIEKTTLLQRGDRRIVWECTAGEATKIIPDSTEWLK